MTSARCCIGRLGPLRHTLGHGHRDGEGQGHHAARRRVAHGRPRAGSDVQYVDADGNRGEVRVPNSRPSRPSFRLRAVSGRPTSGHRGGRRRDGEGRARTSVRVGPTTDPSDTADQTTWRNRRTRTTPRSSRRHPRRSSSRHRPSRRTSTLFSGSTSSHTAAQAPGVRTSAGCAKISSRDPRKGDHHHEDGGRVGPRSRSSSAQERDGTVASSWRNDQGSAGGAPQVQRMAS
jgi:hypothetical protein